MRLTRRWKSSKNPRAILTDHLRGFKPWHPGEWFVVSAPVLSVARSMGWDGMGQMGAGKKGGRGSCLKEAMGNKHKKTKRDEIFWYSCLNMNNHTASANAFLLIENYALCDQDVGIKTMGFLLWAPKAIFGSWVQHVPWWWYFDAGVGTVPLNVQSMTGFLMGFF